MLSNHQGYNFNWHTYIRKGYSRHSTTQ